MADEWYHQAEYDKLKDEQIARIGFRDNMVYAALTAVGAVSVFAMSAPSHRYAFLVLPWVNFVLGWQYVVNDQKISAIGRYVRFDLTAHLTKGADEESQFGWEASHRCDARRCERKIIQTIGDLLTFVVSGSLAIAAFLVQVPSLSWDMVLLVGIEFVLLMVLAWQILVYADFKKGR